MGESGDLEKRVWEREKGGEEELSLGRRSEEEEEGFREIGEMKEKAFMILKMDDMKRFISSFLERKNQKSL